MTGLWVALAGVGVGCGLCLLAAGALPARVPLRSVLAYLDGGGTPPPMSAARPALDERVGRWAGRLVDPNRVLRLWQPSKVAADLAVLERSVESHVGAKVGSAAAGVLTAAAIGGILEVSGVGGGVQVPAALALLLAAGLFVLPDVALTAEAKRRRSELRCVLSMFLDCVDLGLAGGYGPSTALDVAASAVAGPAGQAIRGALGAANRAGETPWSALAQLGSLWGLDELVDAAGTVSLGEGGARIRQSLAARSQSLRAGVQADLQAEAKAATVHSVLPLALLALATVGLVAWPYLARIALPG